MFIINEQFKPTRLGGKGVCKIRQLSGEKENPYLRDITEIISKIMGLESQLKNDNLTIHYGSGTGFMRISKAIQDKYGKDKVIFDVSVS